MLEDGESRDTILDRKLMRYIRERNKNPIPSKWKYDDVSRRIGPVPFH
jgi:hypothetical protein